MKPRDDQTHFVHLPRTTRQELSDLLKQATDEASKGFRPGKSLRTASDSLRKHGLQTLDNELWSAALTGGGDASERLRRFQDTVSSADTNYFQLHRHRKFAEVKTAEAGLKVRANIADCRYFSHYTNLTREQLGDMAVSLGSWLRTLTSHEHDMLAEFLRTSERKYLPAAAREAFPGDTDCSPVTRFFCASCCKENQARSPSPATKATRLLPFRACAASRTSAAADFPS